MSPQSASGMSAGILSPWLLGSSSAPGVGVRGCSQLVQLLLGLLGSRETWASQVKPVSNSPPLWGPQVSLGQALPGVCSF